MFALENYWIVDRTSPGFKKAKRPEQAFALKKMASGHYELKMALLDSEAFVEAAQYEMEENGQEVSNDFIEIVKTICAIGKKNPIAPKRPIDETDPKPTIPFLDDYHKGMSAIYDDLVSKWYNVYSCEVNFNRFEDSLGDIVTEAAFEYTQMPFSNPYYCNAETYNRLCENPELLHEPALRTDFETMCEFAEEITRNDKVYKACKRRAEMYTSSPAYKLMWLTGCMMRCAATKSAGDLIPMIVNPIQHETGIEYSTFAEFVENYGKPCNLPITNILRNPAALFDSIQHETYDPEEECARYEEEDAKKYAAWLGHMSFNPKNRMG